MPSRSAGSAAGALAARRGPRGRGERTARHAGDRRARRSSRSVAGARPLPPGPADRGRRLRDRLRGARRADRKSTRLNSSHVAISYAVFCLKKKNEEDVVAVPTKKLTQTKN